MKLPPTPGLRWAVAATIVLFALRLHLAHVVGFGDAEALYACYGLHPQPAYLDHPGMVGSLFRLIGRGEPATPLATHRFTALAATALPWLGVLAARAAGADPRRALSAFFALALVPEISIGLFALTPDLPLAYAWIATLGLAALFVRSVPGSRTALAGAVLSGFSAGLAIDSKATGVLLLAALVAAVSTRPVRPHLRTAAPWLGLAVALVVASPVAVWEAQRGFPMLAHRFVDTQGRSGFSLRNAGALAGGQLLYVTPPFLVAAFRVFQSLRARTSDPVARLLVLAAIVPAVPLVVLCLWSRAAEPHWLAPAYLSLALGAATTNAIGTRLARAALSVGALAVMAAWIWVGTPLAPERLGRYYVPKYDLANDLYAWRGAVSMIRSEVDDARDGGRDVAVVGPHWIVCAQVHAALGSGVPVGCQSPSGDDFSGWFPRSSWDEATNLLYVTDDRFPAPAAGPFFDRAATTSHRFVVYRGGRAVRTVRVTLYGQRGVAGPPTPRLIRPRLPLPFRGRLP